MKRKVALILLTLVLALTGLMPATIAVAKSNDTVAVGFLYNINEGVVNPAGDSGRFRVAERSIDGVFTSGQITGPFTLTYHANVVLSSQAGNFQGTLATAGGYVLNVNGATEPATFFGFYGPYPLYEIKISGRWNVLSGPEKGNGDFTANLVFIPTPDGHIYLVIPDYSAVALTGSLVP